MVFWIRGHVQEPETFRASRARSSQDGARGMLQQVFRIFRPEYRVTTIKVALMGMGAQAGSNAWQIWLPTYLKTVRHLSIVGTGSFTLSGAARPPGELRAAAERQISPPLPGL
jgi:hypothetical protein